MTQTPSSKETTLPVISKGGSILAIPENSQFLELVDNTPELSPVELHALAVSYQNAASNIVLGNRLAFIALNAIFEHPLVKPHLSAPSRPQVQEQLSGSVPSFMCLLCAFGITFRGCKCPKKSLGQVVKRVPAAGPDLLVEVKSVNEQNTYTVLGVSPTNTPVS